MSEEKKSIITQFKEFISRGNVLDMAVGVIIATAFGKITTSLVNDVFMPLIGWLIGEIDLSTLNITLSPEKLAADGTVAKEAVVIGIGTFVSAVIDFVLVALVVFLMIKAFNAAKDKAESLKKKEEEAAAAEEPAPEPSEEVKLLTEIRDLLKKD